MKPYRITERGLTFAAFIHVSTCFIVAGFVGAIELGHGPTATQVIIVGLALLASVGVQRWMKNAANAKDIFND